MGMSFNTVYISPISEYHTAMIVLLYMLKHYWLWVYMGIHIDYYMLCSLYNTKPVYTTNELP